MSIVLESTRLILRPFQEKDTIDFYNMNLDPDVLRYTGDLPFASLAETLAFIQSYDQYEKYKMGRFTVLEKTRGIYVGWCGLKYHAENKEVDLGFRLNRVSWGKGFATEAGRRCLEYGFDELGLQNIIARAMVKNEASKKVLKKLGFLEETHFYEKGERWYRYTLWNANKVNTMPIL